MKSVSREDRGQLGMVILLLVLLTIASLAILNWRGGMMEADQGSNAVNPQGAMERFKEDAQKIEQLQKAREGTISYNRKYHLCMIDQIPIIPVCAMALMNYRVRLAFSPYLYSK
jgi:hypothetical protein